MADYRDRKERDHYDRPSWKEIDSKKNKSAHVDGGEQRKDLDQRKATTGYGRYKEELSALFDRGEKSKLVKKVMGPAEQAAVVPGGDGALPRRQQLLRAIRTSTSTTELTRLLDEFLSSWEMPEDVEILTQALEHPDEDVQKKALRLLDGWLDGHVAERSSLLRTRIRGLAVHSEDDEIAEMARRIGRKL